MIPDVTRNPTPRFAVGDKVEALGPVESYRGKRGVVVEIVSPGSDLVYRYRVRFDDDTTQTVFGFEIQKAA